MHGIDNYLGRVEQFVNRIDYVPCISVFSGAARICAGIIEVIAGIAAAALNILRNLLEIGANFSELAQSGLIYSLHGAGNIFRGAAALLPGVNLSLYIHDRYLGRMNYPHEFVKEGVYPMMASSALVQY